MMDVLVDVFKSLGVPVGVAVYYMYKDWQLTGELIEVVSAVKAYLERSEYSGEKE
jgi:hypothetical protein